MDQTTDSIRIILTVMVSAFVVGIMVYATYYFTEKTDSGYMQLLEKHDDLATHYVLGMDGKKVSGATMDSLIRELTEDDYAFFVDGVSYYYTISYNASSNRYRRTATNNVVWTGSADSSRLYDLVVMLDENDAITGLRFNPIPKGGTP